LDRKIKLKTIKIFIKKLKKIEIKREYKKIIKTIIKIIFNGSKHPSQKKKKKNLMLKQIKPQTWNRKWTELFKACF
jgi:hypothetical protein